MPIYPNAPISEAVFDIKVDRVENPDINQYEKLTETKLKEYPKSEKRIVVSGLLKVNKELSDPVSHSSNHKVIGVIYSNDTSNTKVQFRKDGFSFNMLKPYSNWEEFQEKAFKYWKIYCDEIQPISIKRIALRYINVIQLPIDNLDFDDYLNDMPSLPDHLESAYSNLFIRFESILKDSGNRVVVTRTFNNTQESHLPFILDIDVFKDENIKVDELKDEFNQLRIDKNNLFESLITDNCRELFK